MDSAQLQSWNEAHPVGTRVLVWPGAREEAPKHSYITHAAGAGPSGSPLVYVKGQGNIALTHVERATGDEAAHDRQYREELVRRAVRWTVPQREIEAAQTLARETVLTEMDFFLGLSAEDFEANYHTLISAALERHLLDWLVRRLDWQFDSYSGRPWPSWPRPAALDHRQRLKLLLGPESLKALRVELPKWLLGKPEKQPYKPEIIDVEKADISDGFWVTLAVRSAEEAFGLGRNLGHPGKEGGVENA